MSIRNLYQIRYISRQLEDNLGEKFVCSQFFDSRTCYLLKFDCLDILKKTKVIVKLYKKGAQVDLIPNPAENEFQSLNKLYADNKAFPELTVPEPLFYLPDLNGLAMELVDGVNLKSFIESANFSQEARVKEIESYYAKLAVALSKIQKIYQINPSSCQKDYFLIKCRDLKGMLLHEMPLYGKLIERAFEVIKTGTESASWNDLATSWTHGDLVHSNIIISEKGELALIDLSDSRSDLIFLDPSRFIIRTTIDYQNCLPKNFIDKLNAVFLANYAPITRINSDLMIFYILELLQCIRFFNRNRLQYLLSRRDMTAFFLLKKYISMYSKSTKR